MKKSLLTLLGTAALVGLAASANAQVIYSGGTYNQDFSSLSWSSDGTGGTWANDSTLTGWSITSSVNPTTAYISSYGGFAGGPNLQDAAAGTYSKVLQINTASGVYDGNNRFGFRTGATPSDTFFTLRLTNNTGSAMNQFSFGYEAAQFVARDGGVLQVRWSFDNSSWTVINGGGTTSGSANLTYTAPVTSNGTTTNLNLTQVNDSITTLSSTVSGISWSNASDLYVQFAFWRNAPATGSSPVVAVDNISFSAIPEPTTWALLAGSLTALVIFRRRRKV